jgi:hypothetical protein
MSSNDLIVEQSMPLHNDRLGLHPINGPLADVATNAFLEVREGGIGFAAQMGPFQS